MSQALSSFLILLGIVLVVLALWFLSYKVVRWDTRRRGLRTIERKAWIVVVVALPLFGFALYLFARVLRHYLTPAAGEGIGVTGGYSNAFNPGTDQDGGQQSPDYALRQVPMPEPAWGNTNPARSNGKAHLQQTPETVRSTSQALRTRFTLLVEQGPLNGQQFILKSLPVLIGRGAEAGIALDADLNVSRKHAEIYEWNGMLRVRDLGSMHGTQINGVPVTDQALTPGDRITIGGTVLILRELI